jgi:Cu/Ag efflux protein CusF
MKKSWLVLGLLIAACGGPAEPLEQYAVKGVIQEVQQGGMVLVIKHEEIPEFMDAMTMPFHVESLKLSAGLKAGDKVGFTITKKGGRWPITALSKSP